MDTSNYYIERIEKASEKLIKRLESEQRYIYLSKEQIIVSSVWQGAVTERKDPISLVHMGFR